MSRRILLFLALCAAAAWPQECGCGEEEVVEEPLPEEEILEEEIVEGLPAGTLARGARDGAAVTVKVEAGGRLSVRIGEEWKTVTLAKLSEHLREAANKHEGGEGFDRLPGGAKASRLYFSLELDPDTPWIHAQWLMIVAAEQWYRKLELSDGTRRVLATLPTDPGPPMPREPAVEILVPVKVTGIEPRPARWGDAEVERPTGFEYFSSGKLGSRVADLAPVMEQAVKAAAATKGATVVGELKAGATVPFGKALEVLDAFAAAGITNVRFFGAAIPGAEVRKKETLPWPEE